MIQRIDHIGIAVDDIEVALQLYGGALGLRCDHIEDVESQGIRSFHLQVGESRIELLAPLAGDSPIGRFLTKNGPGIHHIAFAVDDIEAARARMVAAGLAPIGEPSTGADGKTTLFFHPRSTGGVLIEICARAGALG